MSFRPRLQRRLILTLVSLFLAPVSLASASESQAVWVQQTRAALSEESTRIREEATQAGEEIRFHPIEFDERLNFAPCSEMPAVSRRDPAISSRMTLRVRCPGPVKWQLYVNLEADRFATVAVLSQSLGRKQALRPEHIEMKRINLSSARLGYFTEPEAILNQLARRTLTAGTVLQPGHLTPPLMVNRGDRVVISAKNPVILVRMAGIALANGRLGDQITVENLSSGRRLRATVVDENRVEVTL